MVWKKNHSVYAAAAAAKSLQSCPTLCDPIDGSPPGCPVPGILQARTLEWVAISFSNAWKWKVKVKPLSCVQLLATPWTAAYQAPPSMGFSRQEYWSGVPLYWVAKSSFEFFHKIVWKTWTNFLVSPTEPQAHFRRVLDVGEEGSQMILSAAAPGSVRGQQPLAPLSPGTSQQQDESPPPWSVST